MKYNPDIHHRHSIRLSGYDYSLFGYYFITICTRYRELFFDEFSELKNIVHKQWNRLPEEFVSVDLDEFVIMPNHIHGIIIIRDIPVGATLAVAQSKTTVAQSKTTVAQSKRAGASPAPTRKIELDIILDIILETIQITGKPIKIIPKILKGGVA